MTIKACSSTNDTHKHRRIHIYIYYIYILNMYKGGRMTAVVGAEMD